MAFVRFGDSLINVDQVTYVKATEYGAQFWLVGHEFVNVEGDFDEIVERIADAVDVYVDGPEPDGEHLDAALPGIIEGFKAIRDAP